MNPKFQEQPFKLSIPDLTGEGVAEIVTIPVEMEWDEEIKEWLITPDGMRKIEDTKARLMGLLLPPQFKKLRERYGYTQAEMGELFQVGEKSWTRWESGKHRPSRSISLLIRALYEGEISINYLLKRAGKPPLEAKEMGFDWDDIFSPSQTLLGRLTAPSFEKAPLIYGTTTSGKQKITGHWMRIIEKSVVAERTARGTNFDQLFGKRVHGLEKLPGKTQSSRIA